MMQFLYGAVPATFDSDFGGTESVRRLAGATKPSVWRTFAAQAAVGTVTESRVALQRYVPFLHNSFKPFFVGAWRTSGGHVVLSGAFRMHRAVQVFMSVWLALCIVWSALAAYAAAAGARESWLLPLAGLGMLAFGVALVQLGKWIVRNDTAWLSAVIGKALSRDPP